MQKITALCVIYDADCGFCSSVREWIERQTALLRIEFLALDSPEAKARYPQLPAGELAVVADTGDAWLGNRAWITCLWSLRDYRDWALRLSRPPLLFLAREAFTVISRNKSSISGMLRLMSDREMEQHLRKVTIPTCEMKTK